MFYANLIATQSFIYDVILQIYFCSFQCLHRYVGSDVLRAGIVTNLSSAIEAEFGVMTSRIFRLLNVDVIHNDASSNKRTLILTEYGAVKQWKKNNDKLEMECSK